MTQAAQNAWNELNGAHAQKIPSVTDIDSADKNTMWTGAKSGGGTWELKKNGTESFTLQT